VRRTPNQTDSDVTVSRSCDQGKSQKRVELKDNYGRFYFLSQILQLSYLNVLDLANLLMHHQFPISFFDVR